MIDRSFRYTYLMLLILVYFCGLSQKSVQETKTIALLQNIPEKVLPIQFKKDSSFECFFDKEAWSNRLKLVIKDTVYLHKYLSRIGTIQQRSIYLDYQDLMNGEAMKIINDLLRSGQVYITHNNSKVNNLIYIKKENKRTLKEYFLDEKSKKEIYVYTLVKQGSF